MMVKHYFMIFTLKRFSQLLVFIAEFPTWILVGAPGLIIDGYISVFSLLSNDIYQSFLYYRMKYISILVIID